MNRQEPEKPNRLSMRIWRGVTLQLFLFAVLPLTVLLLVVTFGSLELHHEAMRSLVADRNLRAAQSAAASISKEIRHHGETLELVSKTLPPLDPTGDTLPRLESDLSIFEGGVAVVSPDGSPPISTGGKAVQTLIASPGWDAVQTGLETAVPGKAVYLPVQPVEGKLFVPVIVKGNGQHALVGLFSPETVLAEGLLVLSKDYPVTILVIDPSYQALYLHGSLSPEEHLSTHPGLPEALEGISDIDYLQTMEGEHVITTSPIEPVGWALMIEESWEDIASPLLRATQNAPLIIIPILGLSLLALWFGLRQIVQPMQALEARSADMARGNFATIRQPVGGVPEIRRLQKTLIDMAAQLQEAQNSLRSYIGAITESVEGERRSLARELHDDTLQSLIALGQFTQYALHWNKDPQVEKPLDQVMTLADQSMKDLRRLVQGLRPIYIEDLGLATALAMHTSKDDLTEGMQVHFQRDGKERRLKPEAELALYRIAQEALNNAQRHAGAKNAWISLHFRPNEIILEVRDDGSGFDVPKDPNHYARLGHYGLLSMQERSELIGAKLSVRSTPGEGTHVIVRLADPAKPVEEKEPANG